MQCCTSILDNIIRQENKRHLTEKEEMKLCLFSEDMIMYLENQIESYRKLLELISLASLRKQKQYVKNNCIYIY